MENLFYVVAWVLGSVAVGLIVGFYVGRTTHADRQKEETTRERETMLKALVNLLESTAKLNADVDSHNNEMFEMNRHVGDLKLTGELEEVQHALMGHISSVLESNKRLEDDLICTRFRMEEQAQEIDRTRAEARLDALSGVGNRKAFDETLQFLLAAWNRQNEPFALVLCDVDHFKWINDTHGHPAGDRVVGHVGEYLEGHVRSGDYVARFGGDEFALLLPKTDLDTGKAVAEKILQGISRSNFEVGPRGEHVAVTFSLGVAVVHAGDTGESVLKRSDDALYFAKDSGRNQVRTELDERPVKIVEPEVEVEYVSADQRLSAEIMALGKQ